MQIWLGNEGDGMQTAALAGCERLRRNRRRAHLRQPKKRLQLIFCQKAQMERGCFEPFCSPNS